MTGSGETVTINSYTDPTISNPSSITTGSDGALWFPDGTGTIGRITTNGVVSNYGGPGIGESYGITAGPDGALWFTLIEGDSIGRITTDGIVSDYSDPNDDQPYAITPGPDGALWFTSELNSIGRVTVDGAFSSYGSFQDGVRDPQSITTGPDGALWFANWGNNSIGRITTAGVITNYTDPSIDEPEGITSGPDGALWFTNAGNNSIGRISTTGAVTNYTDQTIDEPESITSGPDGALWFTNAGNNSIGRITTTGVVTNYTASDLDLSPDFVEAITTGPDGALWFTNGGSSIGQVVLPSGAPTITGTPTTPTDGGAPYYFALGVTGVPTATTTVTSGALPPGLNLSSGGIITGMPTALGTYTATVTAKNGIKPKASDTFTITVDPVPPTVSGTPPSNVAAGVPYSFQLTLAGFPAPTTSVTSGALPTGLNLSSSGEITGIPTEAGTYEAQVTATNGYPPDATEDISITVEPALTVSPGTGGPGTEITSNGAGFLPGEDVDVDYVDDTAVSEVLCGSVAVQTDGTFSCSSNIPSGRNAGRDGWHKIVATGQTSGEQAATKFTLTDGVDQPTLFVKPSSNVQGGQIVEAWGDRWTDGAWPIYECARDLSEIQLPYCTKLGTVHVGKGHWQFEFSALIGQIGRQPGSGCDMALRGPESCYVELQQGGTTIAATLSWRPLVLTIDNQPSGGAFRNGKAATVRVGNFPANDRVTIQICANGNQGFECEYKEEGRTDSAGSVTFERYDLNCGQINIEGQCELVAIDTSPRWSDVAQANYFITYGL